jgi:hypothetical protein
MMGVQVDAFHNKSVLDIVISNNAAAACVTAVQTLLYRPLVLRAQENWIWLHTHLCVLLLSLSLRLDGCDNGISEMAGDCHFHFV